MGCGSSKTDDTRDDPELDEFPVPETLPGYPPPRPPPNRKEEFFNPIEYTEIENHARNVPDSKITTYQELVEEITRTCNTELQKLRAIYIWLGHQRIEQQNYPNVTDNSIPRGYMKNIKHGKGNFTAFFTLLCRAANLPCVIIRGKGKSKNYEVGDKDFTELNSQWIAVYVEKSWRLVHPLWSFRAVSGFSKGNWTVIEKDGKAVHSKEAKSEGKNITQIQEFYFLTNPDEFICKCRPDKDPWQLLSTPWSMQKYISVPYFQIGYFTSGLRVISENNCILKSAKGKCWIEFEHDENVNPYLEYQLSYNEAASGRTLPSDFQLTRYVAYSNEVKQKGYVIRFPCEGVYKIAVLGLVEFRLECFELGDYIEQFPQNPEFGYGFNQVSLGLGIVSASPSKGIHNLNSKEKMTFRFEISDPERVRTILVDDEGRDLSSYISTQISGSFLIVEVTMPEEGGEQILKLIQDNQTLINYLMSSDNVSKGDKKDKKDPIREALIRATRGDDIENLELAIDAFEQRKLEDKGDLTKAKKKLQELYEDKERDKDMAVKERRIRERIRLATLEDDVDELESAIEEFLAYRLDDNGDLTDARQKLLELYCRALEQATLNRNADRLEFVIERAKNSRVCGSLRNAQVMLTAEETLRQLKRLQKYLSRILAMKQSTVSEITSYKRPKSCVHNVMKATYLLLGEREKKLQVWENIQTLSRKLGKESLIRRIKDFDVINLKLPVANKSEIILDNYDDEVVRQTSAGAGTFFKWSRNIIDEVQDVDPRNR